MKKRKFSKERINIISEDLRSENGRKIKGKFGLFIVGGIVVLMILSVFAVSLSSNDDLSQDQNKVEYNGYEFSYKQGWWVTNIDGRQQGFEYLPIDLTNISSVDLNLDLKGKTYVLFDPNEFNEDNALIFRLREMLAVNGILASAACIKEENCGDIPVIDCTNQNNLIYLNIGNETKIYKKDNCIVLEAANGEEALVMNKFIYKYLGVI